MAVERQDLYQRIRDRLRPRGLQFCKSTKGEVEAYGSWRVEHRSAYDLVWREDGERGWYERVPRVVMCAGAGRIQSMEETAAVLLAAETHCPACLTTLRPGQVHGPGPPAAFRPEAGRAPRCRSDSDSRRRRYDDPDPKPVVSVGLARDLKPLEHGAGAHYRRPDAELIEVHQMERVAVHQMAWGAASCRPPAGPVVVETLPVQRDRRGLPYHAGSVDPPAGDRRPPSYAEALRRFHDFWSRFDPVGDTLKLIRIGVSPPLKPGYAWRFRKGVPRIADAPVEGRRVEGLLVWCWWDGFWREADGLRYVPIPEDAQRDADAAKLEGRSWDHEAWLAAWMVRRQAELAERRATRSAEPQTRRPKP
jgi:hypothetical protein